MQQIWNGLPKFITTLVGIVLVILLVLAWPLLTRNTPKYSNIDEHFKYASIGGASNMGIPYWIWRVMPVMFPEYLPTDTYKVPGEGVTQIGFMQEPDHDLPIGFAHDTYLGLDVVTNNCAFCHMGSVRESAKAHSHIIPTMPSNVVNLEAYFFFITRIANDPRFNAREMMPYIEKDLKQQGAKLNPLESLLYRYIAIPQTRALLSVQAERLKFLDDQPLYGPGRVDTFTPYKSRAFNFIVEDLPKKETQGSASDFPSIWNQGPRRGMNLHWDGNNASVAERNKSAALALVSPTNIDLDSITRTADWLLDLPAPKYPYIIDTELAAQGEPIFEQNCASCHAFGRQKVGQVTPIEEIGTDSGRLDSYTTEFASNQYTLFAGITYKGEDQRFTHFRKTNGYANHPLDGLWLRAPYLHNGSVPTLRDLLEKPENRPRNFYRGNDVFDQEKLGFVSDVAAAEGRSFFKYDTSEPGNGNGGHLYGTDLKPAEKTALVEYLKSL
ncbi:MAG: cytochrome c [Acaryochloris sp. RU_4_1]|nr:cytochrome c [Acaryochloris sp. RU_4_1]NJR54739.1 cytochrome c [Acaryochloris sp. CRU_2_0]